MVERRLLVMDQEEGPVESSIRTRAMTMIILERSTKRRGLRIRMHLEIMQATTISESIEIKLTKVC